jgi:hypothetical protein
MAGITERQLKAWMRKGEPIHGRSDDDGLTFTLAKPAKGKKEGTATWVLRYRRTSGCRTPVVKRKVASASSRRRNSSRG